MPGPLLARRLPPSEYPTLRLGRKTRFNRSNLASPGAWARAQTQGTARFPLDRSISFEIFLPRYTIQPRGPSTFQTLPSKPPHTAHRQHTMASSPAPSPASSRPRRAAPRPPSSPPSRGPAAASSSPRSSSPPTRSPWPARAPRLPWRASPSAPTTRPAPRGRRRCRRWVVGGMW